MTLDLHMHPDTEALVEALRAVPLGDTASYATLSAAIGVDVKAAGRQRLASARRIALRDHGAAFEPIYGEGLRRLPPDEAARIGSASRKRIKRASNSARKAMHSLAEHSNGLSPEASRKMNAEMSALGLIAQITSDTAVSAVQADSDTTVPPAKASEAFLAHLRAGR